jgi:hypothetical protein
LQTKEGLLGERQVKQSDMLKAQLKRNATAFISTIGGLTLHGMSPERTRELDSLFGFYWAVSTLKPRIVPLKTKLI